MKRKLKLAILLSLVVIITGFTTACGVDFIKKEIIKLALLVGLEPITY